MAKIKEMIGKITDQERKREKAARDAARLSKMTEKPEYVAGLLCAHDAKGGETV